MKKKAKAAFEYRFQNKHNKSEVKVVRTTQFKDYPAFMKYIDSLSKDWKQIGFKTFISYSKPKEPKK